MLYLQAFLDCGLGKTLPLAALDIDIEPVCFNDSASPKGQPAASRSAIHYAIASHKWFLEPSTSKTQSQHHSIAPERFHLTVVHVISL